MLYNGYAVFRQSLDLSNPSVLRLGGGCTNRMRAFYAKTGVTDQVLVSHSPIDGQFRRKRFVRTVPIAQHTPGIASYLAADAALQKPWETVAFYSTRAPD